MPLKDPEARRRYAEAYRAANREKLSDYARARYIAKGEEIRAKNREWRNANQEKMRDAIREWIKKNAMKVAYNGQKIMAKQRSIPFLLTFEEWLGIWQSSGKLEQRGRRKHQFVMARHNDTGPYAIGNVRICLTSENLADCRGRKMKPRSEQHCKAISEAKKRQARHRSGLDTNTF